MAHISSHVFDALEKRGYRVQSHAGAVTAFNSSIGFGRLYPGGYSCEACRASGGDVAGLFFQCQRRSHTHFSMTVEWLEAIAGVQPSKTVLHADVVDRSAHCDFAR